MNYYYHSFAPFGILEFAWHILLVVLVIWLLVRIFGRGRSHRWQLWHAHSALSVLAERYAKGEITKEEYEERKKVLSQ